MARSLVRGVRNAVRAMTRLAQLIDGLVGRRSGIIAELSLVDGEDGDAPLHFAAGRIANPHPAWGRHHGLSVGGCGTTPAQALGAAIGEAVERYAASSLPPAPPCPRHDLRVRALRPRELLPFSRVQRDARGFPFEDPGDDAPLRWVHGSSLLDGTPCAVPAPSALLFDQALPGEPVLGPSHSTGLACAETSEGAVEHALGEVIERDAVALTWLRGVTPPRVPEAIVREVAGAALPPNDAVSAFDLTSDLGIPVLMVLCRGRTSAGDVLSAGTACHVEARRALAKAAIEAGQTRVHVRQLIERDPAWRPARGFVNVSDFPLHARLYAGRGRLARRALRFLDGNDAPAPAFERQPPEGGMIAALRRAGLDAIHLDLTPSWGVALGLHVARVIVPGLLPLHGHHQLAFLGHPRLRAWRSALPHGVRRHRHDIWPYPHPLP